MMATDRQSVVDSERGRLESAIDTSDGNSLKAIVVRLTMMVLEGDCEENERTQIFDVIAASLLHLATTSGPVAAPIDSIENLIHRSSNDEDSNWLPELVDVLRSYLLLVPDTGGAIETWLGYALLGRFLRDGWVVDLVEAKAVLRMHVTSSTQARDALVAVNRILYTRLITDDFEFDRALAEAAMADHPTDIRQTTVVLDLYRAYINAGPDREILDELIESGNLLLQKLLGLGPPSDDDLIEPILMNLADLRMQQLIHEQSLKPLRKAIKYFLNTDYWWSDEVVWLRLIDMKPSVDRLIRVFRSLVTECGVGTIVANWITALRNEEFALAPWLSDFRMHWRQLIDVAFEELDPHAAGGFIERVLYIDDDAQFETEMIQKSLVARRAVWAKEPNEVHAKVDLSWSLLAMHDVTSEEAYLSEAAAVAGMAYFREVSSDNGLVDALERDAAVASPPLAVQLINRMYAKSKDFRTRTRYIHSLHSSIEADGEPLFTRLAAVQWYQELMNGAWSLVWAAYLPFLDVIEAEAEAGRRPDALVQASSLAGRSAYAAAMDGQTDRAFTFAERGQGLLTAAAAASTGRRPEVSRLQHREEFAEWLAASNSLGSLAHSDVPGADDRLPESQGKMVNLSERRRLVERYSAASKRLAQAAGPLLVSPSVTALSSHAMASDACLVYLISSPWGGVALVADRNGDRSVIELPLLTEGAVATWVDQCSVGSIQSADGIPSRGYADEPGADVVERVVDELRSALAPLVDGPPIGLDAIQIVPVGNLAALPLPAAFLTFPGRPIRYASVAVSGRVHIMADGMIQFGFGDSVAAVTDSRPRVPPLVTSGLPRAAAEGELLRRLYGAKVLSRDDATKANVLPLLTAEHRALHLAVHGFCNPQEPELSGLWLANDPGGAAQYLSLADIGGRSMRTRLVFLAACWAGRPGEPMPGEAIGFPTYFIRSGCAGVVAPLWPIRDDIAFDVSERFYGEWLGRGTDPRMALAGAIRYARAKYPDSSSWAAFSYYGV